MINPIIFTGVRLHGGYTIASMLITTVPILDPLGRRAVAQTRINGREFHMIILYSPDDKELSVSIYHEVLEAMTVPRQILPPASSISTRATLNARATKRTNSLVSSVRRR